MVGSFAPREPVTWTLLGTAKRRVMGSEPCRGAPIVGELRESQPCLKCLTRRDVFVFPTMMQWGLVLLLTTLLAVPGCIVAIPEPIYASQVTAAFPEGAEGSEERRVHVEAEVCAGRLNRHRSQAQTISGLQITFTGLGGLAGGVGGIVAALVDESDVDTAMSITAAVGGGITLLGNFLLAVLANPQSLLERHSEGSRSWYRALRLSGERPANVLELLRDCQRDQAPRDEPSGSGDPVPAL